ncbi:MAG: hypothetical protein AAFY22_10890 [Pseudomonadota bacterium]
MNKIFDLKMAAIGLVCAAAMTAGAIAANFGPAPGDYETAVRDFMEERLTNPRAARYQFDGSPYKVYADLGGYEGVAGWAVDVRVKSRLPSGGFGGFMPYTVIFIDGDAVALEDEVQQLTRL